MRSNSADSERVNTMQLVPAPAVISGTGWRSLSGSAMLSTCQCQYSESWLHRKLESYKKLSHDRNRIRWLAVSVVRTLSYPRVRRLDCTGLAGCNAHPMPCSVQSCSAPSCELLTLRVSARPRRGLGSEGICWVEDPHGSCHKGPRLLLRSSCVCDCVTVEYCVCVVQYARPTISPQTTAPAKRCVRRSPNQFSDRCLWLATLRCNSKLTLACVAVHLLFASVLAI